MDELAVIMDWGFAHMQREAGEGGSVYLRLSTWTIEQPPRIISKELRRDIVDGGYWLRRPGANCDLVIAYTGVVAPEAIEAAGLCGESHRDIGLLAITSADRLHAGWTAARKARRDLPHLSHIEQLLAPLPRDCGIVSVIDGHPATLGWLGSVRGHRVKAEHSRLTDFFSNNFERLYGRLRPKKDTVQSDKLRHLLIAWKIVNLIEAKRIELQVERRFEEISAYDAAGIV